MTFVLLFFGYIALLLGHDDTSIFVGALILIAIGVAECFGEIRKNKGEGNK